MASTSIDKWAIDLAGVDAGAKMLVGLAGSLAAAEAADKKAIITLRQDTRHFENLIRRIDAFLIPYLYRKTISRYDCKRATKRTTILFVTHCDKHKGLPSVIERGEELTLDQTGGVGVLTRGVEILTIHECGSST